MKISLERLDSQAFVLDLPGPREERVAVRSAAGLRGVLDQAAERLVITNGAAETVVLDALHIHLGELLLASSEATLEGLALALEQAAAHLALAAGAASITAKDLRVVVDDVTVAGRFTLVGARLSVRDGEGSLAAEQVELAGFSLRIGDLELAAEALSGRSVEIRWGAAGFAMTSSALEAPALEVVSGDTRVGLGGVHVHAFSLDTQRITAGRVTAKSGRVALVFHPGTRDAEGVSPSAGAEGEANGATVGTKNETTSDTPSAEPLLDLRALDGLSGEIDVDVEVDLTVPIIGSRNATHRLRVPIERGALDYRALENNLSALENALLDFSVRDGALVLERVNPLFPARGHGKPIVIWDLDAADLTLAQHEHVRLAVLPRARLAESAKESAEDSEARTREPARKGGVALRKLALHRIDVRLALAPPVGALGGHLRPLRVDSFTVQGNVAHGAAEPSHPGSVLGELLGLSASIAGLPLGASRLDIASVAVAGLSPIELAFRDVHPTSGQVDLVGVVVDGVSVVLAT